MKRFQIQRTIGNDYATDLITLATFHRLLDHVYSPQQNRQMMTIGLHLSRYVGDIDKEYQLG